MSDKQNTFVRFPLAQRIEHILLLISFSTLGLTGLIQKFITVNISLWIIDLLGGISTVRIIHRVAATIFLLEIIYHFVVMGYKLFVQRVEMTMLPGIKDVKDGVQAIGYNIGKSKSRPKLGRFTFDEKVEYWAMMWGNLVMIVTGYMLWNPIKTTNVLPGVFIPAAKAAHGWEAVLAVLAILIWHMYHVHLRHFNKSIFTGKLSRHEMESEHALELEKIEAGTGKVLPPPDVIKKRRRIYFPLAAIISLAGLAGVYFFVTIEKTAISAIPTAENVQILATGQPTDTSVPVATEVPAASAVAAAPAAAASTWDGGIGAMLSAKCAMCHGASGGISFGSYADAMKGGEDGPVIIAGDSANSLIVQLMQKGGHPGALTPEELDALIAWITAGAPEK
jgi:cytochrome b subunit of formate dehydrogenase/mono/diheme cytochrome c family protein